MAALVTYPAIASFIRSVQTIAVRRRAWASRRAVRTTEPCVSTCTVSAVGAARKTVSPLSRPMHTRTWLCPSLSTAALSASAARQACSAWSSVGSPAPNMPTTLASLEVMTAPPQRSTSRCAVCTSGFITAKPASGSSSWRSWNGVTISAARTLICLRTWSRIPLRPPLGSAPEVDTPRASVWLERTPGLDGGPTRSADAAAANSRACEAICSISLAKLVSGASACKIRAWRSARSG